jgi:hypothetical protein
MGQVSRRGFLVGVSSSVALSGVTTVGSATIMRSLTLPALVNGSRRVAVISALASESHYEELGRKRRVVTDTRVRVEEIVAKGEGMETELLVRTLGGKIGRLGERVDGQAQLMIGEACVVFLLQGPDSLHYVNGMAQGHYPLRGASTRRLIKSPDLPAIMNFENSAVKTLVGRELGDAAAHIRSLVKP